VRGFGFESHGGSDRLAFVDIPTPEPGPGEVRVRLRAAAFNRLDRFTLAGIPGVTVELPHVLGSDGAGTVDQVGAGVDGLPTGARVLLNPGLSDGTCEACQRGEEALCRDFRIVGEHVQGTATEFIVVPARNVYPLPERLDFAEGAAVPLVFQTAWRALASVAALRAGERCAIIGAGGGVATAAVQIAKRLGAQVAVATRSPEKGERARRLGADDVLELGPEHPLDRALWRWSEKRGVDVILDSVGRATVPLSVKALARGGRLVVIGATEGPEVTIDLRTIFWRQASIRGSTMAHRKEFEDVLKELAAGSFQPVIDARYPLERGLEAFARLDAPQLFGKVVLTLE
jgi:NADPH:quinone reductase-like Zn-dependent oxidoreductase